MEPQQSQANELCLTPGQFVHIQTKTSGAITVHTGPTKINIEQQHQPVVYDPRTRRFAAVTLQNAVQDCVNVPQGSYCVLTNPVEPVGGSDLDARPNIGVDERRLGQRNGQRIVVQGPADFALWPRESAVVIAGHQLRSNQFVRIRIVDAEQARKNWAGAVVEGVETAAGAPPPPDGDEDAPAATTKSVEPARTPAVLAVPDDLATGKLYHVRGDQVAFYIPPTNGVEVVPDNDGGLVRNALTLPNLHFCTLQGENGSIRHPRGPAVVFPEPTEHFVSENDTPVFKALDLSPIRGIYVKVSAPYDLKVTTSEGVFVISYVEGDELFITGADRRERFVKVSAQNGVTNVRLATADDDEHIVELTVPGVRTYYPRPEHSIVEYEGKRVIYAVSVPQGEARYVLNRLSGEIRTVVGSTMLLPDPRTEVCVQRYLTPEQVQLWYPGDEDAYTYAVTKHAELQQARTVGASWSRTRAPATRGVGAAMGAVAFSGTRKSLHSGDDANLQALLGNVHSRPPEQAAGYEELGDDALTTTRRATFTPPRHVVLDDELFARAPAISVPTGFVVLVISADGTRTPEVGPKTVFLDYDQTLEVLELSTGKPKNTDELKRTCFLRMTDNKVADIIVETRTADHVEADIKVSYRVNFEGDPEVWFDVDNYVKLLCDHARSRLKAAISKTTANELNRYSDATAVVRDCILGVKADDDTERTGMRFDTNGMRVTDVEVLKVTLRNNEIAALLDGAQHEVVTHQVERERTTRQLEQARHYQEVEQEKAQLAAATDRVRYDLAVERADREHTQLLRAAEQEVALAAGDLAAAIDRAKVAHAEAESETELFTMRESAAMAAKRAAAELELQSVAAHTKAVVDRFTAAGGDFAAAVVALGDKSVLEKVAEAGSTMRVLGGRTLPEVISEVFRGTPLEDAMDAVSERAKTRSNGSARPPQ